MVEKYSYEGSAEALPLREAPAGRGLVRMEAVERPLLWRRQQNNEYVREKRKVSSLTPVPNTSNFTL